MLKDDSQYLVKYDATDQSHLIYDVVSDTYFTLDHEVMVAILRTWFSEDEVKRIIEYLVSSYELLIDISARHVSYEPRIKVDFRKVPGALTSVPAILGYQSILGHPMIFNKAEALKAFTETLIASTVNSSKATK